MSKVSLPVALCGMALAGAWGFSVPAFRVFPYSVIQSLRHSQPQIDWPGAHYVARVQQFALRTGGVDVAFVGDSITEFGLWSEWLPGKRVANRGVSYDTIAGIRKRLDSLPDAATYILMAGINDIRAGRPVLEIAADYRAVVEALKARGRVIIVATQEVSSALGPDWRDTNERVRLLNEATRHLSKFVDVRLEPSADGIHLTGPGYAAWMQALAPHLH